LHRAGFQVAPVAQMVLVQHVAVEQVGDRFEAAMRMRREARDIVVRLVGGELVEHQERVQARGLGLPEAAPELDPGAVGRRQ